MDSDELHAIDHLKRQRKLASGATGTMVMAWGGIDCKKAEHEIGRTETNKASILDMEGTGEQDFGNEAWFSTTITKTYSLNL